MAERRRRIQGYSRKYAWIRRRRSHSGPHAAGRPEQGRPLVRRRERSGRSSAPACSRARPRAAIKDLAADLFGVKRHWHKRIIRSGPNTLQPYQENPPDRMIDRRRHRLRRLRPDLRRLGGRLRAHLGDRRRPRQARLRDDLSADVRRRASASSTPTPNHRRTALRRGRAAMSSGAGWEYRQLPLRPPRRRVPSRGLRGRPHRLAHRDRQHRADASHRSVGPASRHWILEVHLVDRERQIGGFYEELLTL